MFSFYYYLDYYMVILYFYLKCIYINFDGRFNTIIMKNRGLNNSINLINPTSLPFNYQHKITKASGTILRLSLSREE